MSEEPRNVTSEEVENLKNEEVVTETDLSEEIESNQDLKKENEEEVQEEVQEEEAVADDSIVENDSEEDEDEENEEDETVSIEELTELYSKMSKEELFNTLKELIEKEGINTLKSRVNLIRNAFNTILADEKEAKKKEFLSQGNEEEPVTEADFVYEESELDTEFRRYYGMYREKRQRYLEEQEKAKQENLVLKNQLLDQLRELLNSDESLKEIYDEFNSIQEKWREIGQVPRAEVNTLWQNYHFLIEKFYDKVKINRELRDLGLKKNLDAKLDLCEKAEELILETSINKSFKVLQELHQQWKEIGPVPSDKNDEIWDRFKSASDKINARRVEHYESMHKDLESNLLAKTAICEKAEAYMEKEFTRIRDWNSGTKEFEEMFALWKTIGPVPKKDNEEIWNRFRSTMNDFYTAKSEFFAKLREEQTANLDKKLKICLEAEAIAERDDWRVATKEIIDLQKKWKEIGPVSRRESDKVWKRFRAACDKFFERKSDFFAKNREEESENIKIKEGIIEEVKAFEFGDSKDENLDTIKAFQRRWSEVGFIGAKHRGRLQKQFREAIDYHFDKLKIDTSELKLSSFQDRIQSDDMNLSKERRDIRDSIKRLSDELNLMENNIGFLAQSKQADILRQEFEKKITNLKQQIALNEAKLRMLSDTK